MKTLKEVSDLVGMSRRVIQEYESAGVAEKPTAKNKYGHLLYGEKEIDRLWQIRSFRDLGYSKKEIKAILSDRSIDTNQLIDQQITAFQQEIQEIQNRLDIAKAVRKTGMTPGELRSFHTDLFADSYDQLLCQIVQGKRILEQEDITIISSCWEDGEENRALDKIADIIDAREEGLPPDSPEVQRMVSELHKCSTWTLSPSIILFYGFYLVWKTGSELGDWLESEFSPEAARYFRQALRIYLEANRNDESTRKLRKDLNLLYRLAKQDPASAETQAVFSVLRKDLKDFLLLSEGAQIQALKEIRNQQQTPEELSKAIAVYLKETEETL